MDFRVSDKTLKWLRLYIEGETDSLPEDIKMELMPYASTQPIEVFRGNYFETREHAVERYKNEDLKKISYYIRSPKSFSINQDVAELFAQDINSNYGIVLRLEINVPYIDLSALPEELTEDFDHEQEILVLEETTVEATVVKEYLNTKSKLGMA